MCEIMRRVALLGLLVVPTVLSFSCIQTIAPENCELTDVQKNDYSRYFSALRPIYGDSYPQTGLEDRRKCGWKQPAANKPELPMFVMSVGLEGAGHHLYSELFKEPVFDCLWVSLDAALYCLVKGKISILRTSDQRTALRQGCGRRRAENHPRDAEEGLARAVAIETQSRATSLSVCSNDIYDVPLNLRAAKGVCLLRSIFDAEDSFPTGAIRKNGRVFMHPDMVNTQKMHGDLFNVKYVLILRNTTVRKSLK